MKEYHSFIFIAIVFVIILFCNKKQTIGGINTFYKEIQNKKCSNINKIINNISNIDNCKKECFKDNECLCLSYDLKQKDCSISDNNNIESLIDNNTTISLIKNKSHIDKYNNKLYKFESTIYKKYYVLYNNENNQIKFELKDNESFKSIIGDSTYIFSLKNINNETYIVSYCPNNNVLHNLIVGTYSEETNSSKIDIFYLDSSETTISSNYIYNTNIRINQNFKK